MNIRDSIHEGMTVRSRDGDKLGKIFALGEDTFQVEKGLFFPKDYLVRYADVSAIEGDTLTLGLLKDEIQEAEEALDTSAPLIPPPPVEEIPARRERAAVRAEGEEMRVPLVEEERDVVKRDRQVGVLHIKKEVVEEVRREGGRVERMTSSADEPIAPSAASFQEEVEVTQRPRVAEDVRIRRERLIQEQRVAEPVREEEVRRREEDEVKGAVRSGPDSDVPHKTRY